MISTVLYVQIVVYMKEIEGRKSEGAFLTVGGMDNKEEPQTPHNEDRMPQHPLRIRAAIMDVPSTVDVFFDFFSTDFFRIFFRIFFPTITVTGRYDDVKRSINTEV